MAYSKKNNLNREKSKLEENYQKLVVDVNCLLDAQEQMAMEFNYQQFKRSNE